MNKGQLTLSLTVVILLFQIWNLYSSQKTGRIYLGLLSYKKSAENNDFRVGVICNVIWTVMVLAALLVQIARLTI